MTIIKNVLKDLQVLFKKNEILGKDFDNFLKQVKTPIVKDYLTALKDHTKPEDALKYYFFSKDSVFVKFLFKKLHPEVGGESGFVDYLIKDEREEIKLEIKPLFEAEFEKGKSGEIFKRIKKVKLNWEKYKDQIRKYLGRRGEFVVFTNLEEWYFFSRNFSLDENCYYFSKINLFDLIKDFQQIGDFWQYLDRQEELSVKEPLDKKFFNSLRTWVEELGEVKFKVDEKKKTELIIKLVNKFIFIQTLDNFYVIKGKYLEEKWVNIEREWQAKNKLRILRKFLFEIDEYFYELYDTELFKEEETGKTTLDYIERTDENIELFYNKLKLVLGIDYGTTAIGWERGIIQYNFRRIDEDILGKAYETFLAEVRKEQGIYYTPKYITQYIVENTVGKIYNELLEKIKKNLEEKNFDECRELIKKFISIKVLDPACGSGSFLIKALRLIWNKYNELLELLAKGERKYNNFKNGLTRSKEDEENSRKITELKNILNFKDKRDLISKIIIRHIHGNDLDANALEVAKVNLWLEAIKLAPSEFRYDRLPADTNHILPDLEMNLGNGDSLVGLPEDLTIEILKEKHENELKRLFELRKEYLDNPTKEDAIKEINEINKKLRKELDEEFKKYLEENNLPLEILEKTKPFHWALDFWFIFFDEDLEPKEKDEQGFDAVIGNPPYFTEVRGYKEVFRIYKVSPLVSKYYEQKMDVFYFFIERSLDILKNLGYLGYIIMEYWKSRTFSSKLREKIVKDSIILEAIEFNEFKVFEDAPGQHNSTIILQKNCEEGIKQNYTLKLISIINPNVPIEDVKNALLKRIHAQGIVSKDIKMVYDRGSKNIFFADTSKVGILDKLLNKKNFTIPNKLISQGLVSPQEFVTKKHIYSLIKKGIRPPFKEGEGIFVISHEEILKISLTSHEKKLIRPFYFANQIDTYYFDEENSHYVLYITKPYIDYDKNDIVKFSKENNISINEASKRIMAVIKSRYPNLIRHLDRFQDIITSDKKPYGLHRPRNEIIFETENKIISIRKTDHPKFVHVPIPYYINQSVNYIVINKKGIIPYLVALFNSKLAHYFFKNVKTHGEQLQVDMSVILQLPIYLPSKNEKTPIIQLVQKIITLKKLQHKFRELWVKTSRGFGGRNSYRSLYEIMEESISAIQSGEPNKAWILESNIIPNEQNELLEKEFKKFRIVGESDNKLKIYGIEGQREELLLEITTSKKEFMDIIYLELLELMDSRVKKKTLKDILSKSEISVIQPNIWEKSGNLLKIIKEKFREWLEKENFEIKEEDIVKIDNETQEIDNLIDAHVFKLYGLTKEEVEIVLDSLNVVESIKKDILRKFEDIKGGKNG